MTDGFVITGEILANPKYLACSVLARQIYFAMIMECDHEGREIADPLTWTRHASLFGAAAATTAEVIAALAELDQVRLAVRYVVTGKPYLFLPGRFEHNTGRKYWKRSNCPLPPADLLAEFPEYAVGLAMLTTKSEMRRTLRDGEARRYPQVAHQIPESSGHQVGLNRESTVGVGVGLGVVPPTENQSSIDPPTEAESGTASFALALLPAAQPVAVMMPVREGLEPITEREAATWQDLYGNVHVNDLLKRMVGYWTATDTSSRKTRKGIRKSIDTWLAKEHNRARAPAGARASPQFGIDGRADRTRAALAEVLGELKGEGDGKRIEGPRGGGADVRGAAGR